MDESRPQAQATGISSPSAERQPAEPSCTTPSHESHGRGNQYDNSGGTQNVNQGSGTQISGNSFSGPVYINTSAPTDAARKCLEFLFYPEMDSRYHDIDDAARETCDWLLRHETYVRWSSGTGDSLNLLWIRGHPGSGKSTLMRYAVDHTSFEDEALLLRHFFHGRGTDLQKDPLGLYRSLLHQLLTHNAQVLPDLVAVLKRKSESGNGYKWHTNELRRLFESSLPKVLDIRPVWLFIDALDECGDDVAVDLAERCETLVEGLSPAHLSRFRLCFSCRHYPIVTLDRTAQICVEKENSKDISVYVQQRLFNFNRRWQSSQTSDMIIQRAQGVFLWAFLVVNQVLTFDRKGLGLSKIEEVVSRIPSKLEDLYHSLARNMDSESWKLIRWICYALRPLEPHELPWALVVRDEDSVQLWSECLREIKDRFPPDEEGMERRIRTLSCGLAEISVSHGVVYSTRRTGVVQFIHQSVRDFFAGQDPLVNGPHRDGHMSAIVHSRLAMICINTVVMTEWDDQRREYAACYWAEHLRKGANGSFVPENIRNVLTSPSSVLNNNWEMIASRYDFSTMTLKSVSVAHVLVEAESTALLRIVLDNGADTEAKERRTLLSLAANRNRKAAVQMLLDRHVDLEVINEQRETPLALAAERGHEVIVQMLLDRNANCEARDRWEQTPLALAAKEGHEAVVRMLLDRNANLEAADGDGCTPLSMAVDRNHKAIVKLLLDRGASVHARDQKGRTPLLSTGRRDYHTVVRLLLDRGADVNAKDEQGWTPLLRAASDSDDSVARLLIDRGADLEANLSNWGTPLLTAVFRGREAIVQLLVDRGADLEAKKNNGTTPLSMAAQHGQEAIVQLLLDRGADLEAKKNDGATPLSTAAIFGREAMVQLLLDRGADIGAKNHNGDTAFLLAATNGHDATVQLLLDRGAGLEEKNHNGDTSLSMAVTNGKRSTVQLLLDRGADANAKYERTALVGNLSSRLRGDGATLMQWAADEGMKSLYPSVREAVRLVLDWEATHNESEPI